MKSLDFDKGKKRVLILSWVYFVFTAVAVSIAFITRELTESLSEPHVFVFLCILLGVVLLLPSIYLILRRRFDFFHPLVYPVFTYLFPALVLGGLYLKFGSDPSDVLLLVPNPDYHLSLSILYIILGFIGLIFGFAILGAVNVGRALSRHIPEWKWEPSELRLPCLFILLLGFVFNIYSFFLGATGFQVTETPSIWGGLLNAISNLTTIAGFILWHAFFRREKNKRENWSLLITLFIALMILSLLTSGSRSTLLFYVILIFAAYRFSGRQFRPRTMLFFAALTIIALFVGINLGTTFRMIKGSENPASFRESLEVGLESMSAVANLGFKDQSAMAIKVLLSRFQTLGSFSVVVANYEYLRPVEEQFDGVANNIWISTWTSFIPRFIWPNKPKISDARIIGAIYFGDPNNSYGITVFGDLLRNFGPIGVPIGMALLGFYLKILYVAFLEKSSFSAWRTASYFMFLGTINYESFYGNILPGAIRTGFTLLIAGFFINIISRVKVVRGI